MRSLSAIARAAALSAALVAGGCAYPDGSPNYGGTLAIGAGAALAAGLLIASSNRGGSRTYYNNGYQNRGYQGGGYQRGGYQGGGYGRSYGGSGYAYNRGYGGGYR